MSGINRAFEEWATRKFGGTNGGNPKSKLGIWICGMEFRVDGDKKDDFNNGHWYWLDEKFTDLQHLSGAGSDSFGGRYDKRVAKLVACLCGGGVDDWQSICGDVCAQYPRGLVLSLNLYPLGAPRHSHLQWSEERVASTGLTGVKEYVEWCNKNRFPWFQSLVQKFNPRYIVCTGLSCREDFIRAFAGERPGAKEFKRSPVPIANLPCEEVVINDGKTVLLITPFFGQMGRGRGSMTDDHLREIAAHLKKGLEQRLHGQ